MMTPKPARSIVCLSALFALNTLAAFYGAPPDAAHPWAVHDDNRPQPKVVTPPPRVGDAPSDATILFDGTEASFQNWVHRRPADKRKNDWVVKDGALQCNAGSGPIATREAFGDCQLHIEWASPNAPEKHGQARGNSGVFFLERIEVQVLDNYQNPTYPDGSAGSVYGVMPPAAIRRSFSRMYCATVSLRRTSSPSG